MGVGAFFKKAGRILAMPVTAPVKLAKQGAEKTMQVMVAGIVRHVLTTIGGGLIASGTLSHDELSTAIGAISTLIGVAWSVLGKRKTA